MLIYSTRKLHVSIEYNIFILIMKNDLLIINTFFDKNIFYREKCMVYYFWIFDIDKIIIKIWYYFTYFCNLVYYNYLFFFFVPCIILIHCWLLSSCSIFFCPVLSVVIQSLSLQFIVCYSASMISVVYTSPSVA